jgi:AraC-like DNA-binding protein
VDGLRKDRVRAFNNMSAKLQPLQATHAPIPAAAAQWLVKVLGERGIAPSDVLAGTGLADGWSDLADASLEPTQYERLLRNALSLSGDEALGLTAPRQANYLGRYGFWGYAVMSCTTLGEAIDTSIRYWALSGSLVRPRPVIDGKWLHMDIDPAFDFVRGDIYRFAIEKTLSSVQMALLWMADRAQPFHAVCVAYPAPRQAKLYRELLGCPVQFDAPLNRITMPATALKWPQVTSQPHLADVCRERCAQAMLRLRGEDALISAIQSFLCADIGHLPSLDQMAARLGMAPRTLRRQLQQRGASYQRVVDGVREATAREYLLNTQLSIDQIAALVGFSEATTFRSTFKRWTGQSAAQVRRTSTSP